MKDRKLQVNNVQPVTCDLVGKTKHFVPRDHIGSFCFLFPSLISPISFLNFIQCIGVALVNEIMQASSVQFYSTSSVVYCIVCSPPKSNNLKSFLFFLSRNHSYSKISSIIFLLVVNFQVGYLCSMINYPLGRLFTCLRPQENNRKYLYPI